MEQPQDDQPYAAAGQDEAGRLGVRTALREPGGHRRQTEAVEDREHRLGVAVDQQGQDTVDKVVQRRAAHRPAPGLVVPLLRPQVAPHVRRRDKQQEHSAGQIRA